MPDGLEEIRRGHPLYEYLSRLSIWPASTGEPVFEFMRADSAPGVFICREVNSDKRIVCKFFSARPSLPPAEARHIMAYEWFCLRRTRLLGLSVPPFRVVRPLGTRVDLGCLLAEEYVPGNNLDYYIGRAAHDGDWESLTSHLDQLAEFFAHLHALSVRSKPPHLSRTCGEFRTMIRTLDRTEGLSHAALSDLSKLCDKWESLRSMWDGYSSLVHGDATPTNFIFQNEDGVTAIDFERMHVGDPVYDVGLLVAELKHHFALRILCSEAAEPFISHFLHSYARHSSVTEAHFDWLAFRSRFYMALGELRIARNSWLPRGHRNWLIAEAHRCLRR
jgi:aminoglycoside phosphotransferase